MSRRKPNDGWHELLSTHIAGAHHHDYKGALAQLTHGTVLMLVREPDNPYDKNAVRIETDALDSPSTPVRKVGYIPATQAPMIGRMLALGFPVRASVDVVEPAKQLVLIEVIVPAWGLPTGDPPRTPRTPPRVV